METATTAPRGAGILPDHSVCTPTLAKLIQAQKRTVTRCLTSFLGPLKPIDPRNKFYCLSSGQVDNLDETGSNVVRTVARTYCRWFGDFRSFYSALLITVPKGLVQVRPADQCVSLH